MKTQAAVAFEAGKPLEICEVELEGPKTVSYTHLTLPTNREV